MAIFHLSMTIAKRNNGSRSLIAMASYRSGEKLYSELYEKTNFYNHRNVQPDSFILKPEHVPNEFLDRQTLWNKLELIEKSPNAQLCREINVALPIELNNEDQKKLVTEFVKDNFVAEGMIADVSIHRDDEHNPHAHIMLSMREIDSEGNILNKSKREPKLDEYGNQIYNEKGQRLTISIKTNNWNRKTFVQEIRTDWANKNNRYFQERNIDQQITEKSHAELGKKELPQIHEGFYTKKLDEQGIVSELRKKNIEINNFNDSLDELDKLEFQQKSISEDKNFTVKFEKTFSPLEKKELKNLSSELKIFIDDKNIDKRMNELKRWENSLLFNNKLEVQKQRLQLNKIYDEREKLQKADEILDKQASRFLKKVYPELITDKFNAKDIRSMVNETIFRKERLSKNDLVKAIYNDRLVDSEQEKKLFKEKPFQTERFLRKKIAEANRMIEKESDPHRKALITEKVAKLENLQVGLKDYVTAEVESKFDKNLQIDNVIEGELLLAKAEYYQTTDFNSLEQATRFTANELNRILEQSRGYLSNVNDPKIPNDCQGIYLIQDSMKNIEELSPLAKHNLKKLTENNSYIPSQDQISLKKEIDSYNDNNKKLSHAENEMAINGEVQIFYLAKGVQQLLKGLQAQKKQRNIDKLIKQTKVNKNHNQNRNIPFR